MGSPVLSKIFQVIVRKSIKMERFYFFGLKCSQKFLDARSYWVLALFCPNLWARNALILLIDCWLANSFTLIITLIIIFALLPLNHVIRFIHGIIDDTVSLFFWTFWVDPSNGFLSINFLDPFSDILTVHFFFAGSKHIIDMMSILVEKPFLLFIHLLDLLLVNYWRIALQSFVGLSVQLRSSVRSSGNSPYGKHSSLFIDHVGLMRWPGMLIFQVLIKINDALLLVESPGPSRQVMDGIPAAQIWSPIYLPFISEVLVCHIIHVLLHFWLVYFRV